VHVDGKRVAVPMPGIAHEDVEAARIMARRVAVAAVRSGVVPEHKSETVAEYAERWLDDREARGLKSVADDRWRMAKHVTSEIGTMAMVEVTRERLEDLVTKLDDKARAGLSWKTVANVWTLVTSMFDDATNAKNRSLRVLATDPTDRVRGPDRGTKKAKQFLYPSELLSLVTSKAVPARYKLAYVLSAYTGLRAGELKSLTWGDVNLAHATIQVSKAWNRNAAKVLSTKSGEARRIPIEPALMPLLRALADGKRAQDLVAWVPKQDARATTLREHLKAAGVRRPELLDDGAHVKHMTFHDLRSTYITWAAVRGDDPLRIKQRAGHSGFATTEGYIRTAENLSAGFGTPFPGLPLELATEVDQVDRKTPKSALFVVGRPGLEPGTYGLKVRSSTD